MNPVTSGPVVNESLETNIPGVFACGNVLHVHDLVDYVSGEAAVAGENAATYLKERAGKAEAAKKEADIRIVTKNGVRYSVPSTIHMEQMADKLTVRFRVGDVYKDKALCVYLGEDQVSRTPKRVMAPGEMEQVILLKSKLLEIAGGSIDEKHNTLTITIEEK
jgi:hypothetical protein